MAGKGDKPRPLGVSREQYERNFEHWQSTKSPDIPEGYALTGEYRPPEQEEMYLWHDGSVTAWKSRSRSQWSYFIIIEDK